MKRPSPETRAALIADYVAGMSQKAVARKYKVSACTAHRYVHAAGVSRDVKSAQRAAVTAAYEAEYGLGVGQWVRRGLVWHWEASVYADRKNNIESINHQEIPNAA